MKIKNILLAMLSGTLVSVVRSLIQLMLQRIPGGMGRQLMFVDIGEHDKFIYLLMVSQRMLLSKQKVIL